MQKKNELKYIYSPKNYKTKKINQRVKLKEILITPEIRTFDLVNHKLFYIILVKE